MNKVTAADPIKPEPAAHPTLKYKRVVLKLSGEMLMGNREAGLDGQMISMVCNQVAGIKKLDAQIALVVGGGNIFRGLTAAANGMDRVGADFMGMLATVINALALQDYLENLNYYTRVMSAIEMPKVCEPFIRRRPPCAPLKSRPMFCSREPRSMEFTIRTRRKIRMP